MHLIVHPWPGSSSCHNALLLIRAALGLLKNVIVRIQYALAPLRSLAYSSHLSWVMPWCTLPCACHFTLGLEMDQTILAFVFVSDRHTQTQAINFVG